MKLIVDEGPELFCSNLANNILENVDKNLAFVIGKNMIFFNTDILCSLSPLLFDLVQVWSKAGCCSVHDQIHISLSDKKYLESLKILKRFLKSGVIEKISQFEEGHFQELLKLLGLIISYEREPNFEVETKDKKSSTGIQTHVKTERMVYEDNNNLENEGEENKVTKIDKKVGGKDCVKDNVPDKDLANNNVSAEAVFINPFFEKSDKGHVLPGSEEAPETISPNENVATLSQSIKASTTTSKVNTEIKANFAKADNDSTPIGRESPKAQSCETETPIESNNNLSKLNLIPSQNEMQNEVNEGLKLKPTNELLKRRSFEQINPDELSNKRQLANKTVESPPAKISKLDNHKVKSKPVETAKKDRQMHRSRWDIPPGNDRPVQSVQGCQPNEVAHEKSASPHATGIEEQRTVTHENRSLIDNIDENSPFGFENKQTGSQEKEQNLFDNSSERSSRVDLKKSRDAIQECSRAQDLHARSEDRWKEKKSVSRNSGERFKSNNNPGIPIPVLKSQGFDHKGFKKNPMGTEAQDLRSNNRRGDISENFGRGYKDGFALRGGSGGGEKDEDWNCPECRNLNYHFRNNCNSCGVANPVPRKPFNTNTSTGAPIPSKPFNPTRRPGDWDCPKCGKMNFASRTKCYTLNCDGGGSEGGEKDGDWNCPDGASSGGGENDGHWTIENDGNWDCPECGYFNYHFRKNCYRCFVANPGSLGGIGRGQTNTGNSASTPVPSQPWVGARRPGDWDCPKCGKMNFASRIKCYTLSCDVQQLFSGQFGN